MEKEGKLKVKEIGREDRKKKREKYRFFFLKSRIWVKLG